VKTRRWRIVDIGMRDPDACPVHQNAASYVRDVVHHKGFIQREHGCRLCTMRWVSYQTILDPKRIKRRPASTSA
jgi:hypothetical protein